MDNPHDAGRIGPAGTALRASGKDGPQLIQSAGKRWTDEAEALFLDHLAASCNVTYAAAQAGFSKAAVYRRRRTDPAFAGRWQAAKQQAYVRIEMALIQRALEALEGREPDPDTPMPAMTVREAIEILKLNRASVEGRPARYPGWRARPRSIEEMRASILRKLQAIAAMPDDADDA